MIDQEQKQKAEKVTKNYMKYSGIAFQLVGILVFSFLIGQWVDNKVGNRQPLIAIVFTMVMFSGYMYRLYKELM
jgi:F0F1-type ATP synthase assembly protein I